MLDRFVGQWFFGDMHLGWRGEPITPGIRGPTVSGERPFSYVDLGAYSGLSRPVSTWTPGPIVDDTVIFFR